MNKVKIFSFIIVCCMAANGVLAANSDILQDDGVQIAKSFKHQNRECEGAKYPPGLNKVPPGHSKTPPGWNKVPPGIAKKKPMTFWDKVLHTILFWKD